MTKSLLLLTAAMFSTAAFAFENNCRVDTATQYAEVIVDGVAIAHFTFPDEAYIQLGALRAIGACEPSRCQLGVPNSPMALKVEDDPVEFNGTLSEAMAVFAEWRDQHLCDLVPTTEASVTPPVVPTKPATP